MPYNGVGTFTSLGAPTFPAVPSTYILASYFNSTMNDIFAGLSGVMTRDGQAPMTANLPMGGFKVTNIADGASAQDAVAYHQVFNSPIIANPAFTGTPIAPTAPPGTSTTQLATTAFVMAQAFNSALPAQTGNAGKFVTTDGNTASWGSLKTVGLNSISGSGDIPLNYPAQLITASTVTATSGQCLALTNSTTQGAATNLFLYSEQMDIGGTWYAWHTSVTSNMTMAPDGNTTADKIVEDTAVSNRALQQNVTVAANQPYTMQVAVKAAGRTMVGLSLDKDAAGVDRVRANFNLTTGATSSVGQDGTGSGQSATCTYLGNGWYLCTLTGTASTSAGTYLRCIIHVNGVDVPYTGDGVSGIYVWGAQFESGSTATSYIPTTTTTATRSAGVVAPQRIVLPASPSADAWVKVIVANGIETNIVDPNGATIMGTNGPIQLDNPYASVTFQYIGSTWRMINA